MRRDAEFARWYTTHHDRIRSLCARILRDPAAAEDIAQETLLRAWVGRERMREEDLGAWLSVVARNLCVSYMRRHERVVPTEVLPELPDASADPARQVERLESRRAVRKAMREVSERHRILLFRREVEEIDYEDLGAELGLTAGGTRALLFRARRVLRERLVAVGEGLSGIFVGARYGVRGFRSRLRTTTLPGEPSVAPVLQSTLNVLLALGVALATSVAGTHSEELRYSGGAPSAITRSVASLDAPRGDTTSRFSSERGAGVESSRANPRGNLIPNADVKPFDVEDKRSELTLYVAGHSVTFFVNGMDGDGLDPAYRAIDTIFGPLCTEEPDVCTILRGDPAR